ncbi:MAG TPA: hypothetical protein VGS22_01765 [Thermoanaerobaculia bacterium]|jgi:transcriptional regulator with XRE-family HTH domain|nr:hypothetical protein [Thermoanaerobaculia bacterium]
MTKPPKSKTGRKRGARPSDLERERSAFAVRLLCARLGRHQSLMAQKTGIAARRLTEYRSGQVIPRPAVFAKMAAAAKLSVARVHAFVADCFRDAERWDLEGMAAAGDAEWAAALGSDLALHLAPRAEALKASLRPAVPPPAPPTAEDRAAVPGLWARLETIEEKDRERAVAEDSSFHHWALAEQLAQQSAKGAPRDPKTALALATLALEIAELLPGTSGWRSRNRGFALAHLANARKVGSDLPAAERDFVQARRLFAGGAKDDPGLLDESRLLDLEASLHSAQRKERLTLSLLDQARALARTPHAVGRVLLKRAVALEQFGRQAEAIPVLREAMPLLDEEAEPRSVCVALFNLAVDLLDLGRLAEAAELLPDVRARAERIGFPHDLLRLRWLEARFEIARGRAAEGIAALDAVRAEFVAEKLSYDAALAALELATLHLDRGAAGSAEKARALAEDVFPVFQAQGVRREGLAAVRLFVEAAKREAATAEQARQALAALRLGRG